MKERPECPLCVTRTCANCFFKDVAVNRLWIDKHLPGGECRRCGAAKGAVTERPVRHTNRARHEDHVEAANRKPTERVTRDPIAVAEALDLLATLDDVFFKAYNGARYLPTDDDRDRRVDEEHKARNWNEGTDDLLELVAVVRRWVAENSGDGDG